MVTRLVAALHALLALAIACTPLDRASDALTYRVDPELAPLFAHASERIYAASGVRLTEGGGTPILAVPELPSSDGADDCGLTRIAYSLDPFRVVSVQIEILWPQPPTCGGEGTVLHELVHSLRRRLVRVEENDGHSADGVFSARGGNRLLTEASLSALCEGAPCGWFVPEEGR